MTMLSFRPLLRSLSQGLTVAVLLAGMAMMAFAASLTLLVGMIVFPVAIGLSAGRQNLRGRSAAMTSAGACRIPSSRTFHESAS